MSMVLLVCSAEGLFTSGSTDARAEAVIFKAGRDSAGTQQHSPAPLGARTAERRLDLCFTFLRLYRWLTGVMTGHSHTSRS
ncbi:hypothetical protein INR49_014074 [Caranx melampygus]|nr:hypothetical protein INR49_014074 [Caranx melampygus]